MAIDKRRLLGALYRPLVKARSSEPVRRLAAAIDRPGVRAKLAPRQPIQVDVAMQAGLGATLAHALLVHHWGETQRRDLRVVSSNPLYTVPGETDCLAPYFAAPGSNASGSHGDRIAVRYKTSLTLEPFGLRTNIALDAASAVFRRRLAPTALVTAEADDVLRAAGRTQFDLAIHYRGTDKMFEARPVAFDDVFDTLRAVSGPERGVPDVFLATDDMAFDGIIKAEFPDVKFWSYTRGTPSDPTAGRHFSDLPPSDKALEAAVNMVLIARAAVVIRSTSYMSAISPIINPALRTITLNRTDGSAQLFPEREILASEAAYAFRDRW